MTGANFFTQSESAAIEHLFELPADGFEDSDQMELRNQVARIALVVVQDRLPQVGIVNDGEVTLGRQRFSGERHSVTPLPLFLFTINWADTAPGISWPESYHVTYLPGYDRYVVTAAQDSPDSYGFSELVIGHFSADLDVIVGSKVAITDWWRYQNHLCGQERWAYVWDEAAVSASLANQWADEVWPEYADEEDDNA